MKTGFSQILRPVFLLGMGFGLFFSSGVFAKTELKSYSNYFYKTATVDDAVAIYAGSTDKTCSNPSTTSPCNSCTEVASVAGTALVGSTNLYCNTNQIHPDLLFQVTIGSDAFGTCSTQVGAWIGGAFVNSASTFDSTAKTGTVSIRWGEICSKMGSSSSCAASFSAKTLTIGVDKDCLQGTAPTETGIKFNISFRYVAASDPMTFGCGTGTNRYEGLCEYRMYPGDGKAYLAATPPPQSASTDFKVGDFSASGATNPSVADPSGMTYAAVRLYYQEGSSFAGITPKSSYSDLKISGTDIKDRKVTGLKNYTSYAFMAANVDQAGNVTYFSNNTTGAAMNPAPSFGTTQGATPEPVFGLLDGKSCFIATAAYGSEDAADVELLRKFRNRFLLSWSGGQNFVRTYYRLSPPIARFIAESSVLKWTVRTALKPFVLMAEFSLRFGAAATLGLILSFGLVFTLAIRRMTFSASAKRAR